MISTKTDWVRQRRTELILISVVLVLVFAIAWPRVASARDATNAQPPPSDAALKRAGDVFNERTSDQGIPAGVAVVVARTDSGAHREVMRTEVYVGRRIGANTPFVIGSTSKSFTALAAMQLVERGDLNLDAPITRWVPELKLTGDGAESITLGQVLAQTSGIPPLAGGPVLRSAKAGTMLDAIAELDGVRLLSRPGTQFHYANANYVLAGLAVERAAKQPFASYVEEHIFRPLGSRCSSTSLAAAKADGLAVGHRYWFGLVRAHGPAFSAALQPAGYLISCASDLGRYVSMLLNGGVTGSGRRLVSEKSLAIMLDPGAKTTLGPWADAAPSRYGLGWFVGGPWKERAILHPGDTPDSSSMLVLLPDRGWGVVTLLAAGHNLELPGSPDAMDLTSRNVVDALLGEPIKQGSLTRFYAVFDLLALVLLALSGWPLVRSLRGRSAHRGRALLVAIALLVPGLLLLAIPTLGLGWSAFGLWMPDLALVLLLAGGMFVLAALTRVVQALAPTDKTPQSPTNLSVP